MKVFIYSLQNLDTLEKLSRQARSQGHVVHDVSAPTDEVPVGIQDSPIDQIWYLGTVLTKLADMFSARMFDDQCEFIFDTDLTILNTSVKLLAYPSHTIIDYRQLL